MIQVIDILQLQALARTVDIETGSIRLDGVDVSRVPLQRLRLVDFTVDEFRRNIDHSAGSRDSNHGGVEDFGTEEKTKTFFWLL